METFTVSSIVNADGISGPSDIVVDTGTIRSVTPAAGAAAASPGAARSIVVPGFIDMHTHGGAGSDIMDTDRKRFAVIGRHHLSHGTTTYLGSTTTAPVAEIARVLADARTAMGSGRTGSRRDDPGSAGSSAEPDVATLLGIHVEGPWIAPERAGAQNPVHMHAPDAAAMALVRDYADVIRMITFSYHYAAADRFLELLLELSIIPACGHDQTVDERILAGFARGLRHVTHIYSMNASFMRVDGRKHLGTLEMALMTPGVMVEVIADGKHITEHFWRFIRHNKDVDDIVIVSDSMRWAGMPDDPDRVHKLGDVDVIVDDGVAWLADRSAFAGSVGTMHGMFRRLVQEWGVDLRSAVQMTSANQARELGIDDRVGAVKPGMVADFVILDDGLEIKQVVKAGRSFRPDSQES